MDKAIIAKTLNCSEPHVNLILNGKRNPFTPIGLRIVNMAAEIYGDKCKYEFMQNVFKNYNLRKNLKKMKADLINECEKHNLKKLQ